MDTSLPPIPADLWPPVHPAQASRPKGKMLTLEVPGLSENLLLSVLARAIHLEMRAAGEWAARSGATADNEFPSARNFSGYRAENAARLLGLYTVLFALAQHRTSSDQTPEALRASASHSYQLGLRDERRSLETRSPAGSQNHPKTESASKHFSTRR